MARLLQLIGEGQEIREQGGGVEYPMGDSPLRRDLVAGVPSLADGFVKPSDEPGWGIEIDPVVLAHYGQQHG